MPDPRDLRSLQDACWTALAESATTAERRVLLSRVLLSPEFNSLRRIWSSPLQPGLDDPSTPPGTDEGFVRIVYECLLGREADQSGLRHYLTALNLGGTRASVLRDLALSDEFARRVTNVPADRQLCELANPAKWDSPEWLDTLRSLGLSDNKLSMHRKAYEFTQLVYGCRMLGALRPDSMMISIGAGHEMIAYWLANEVHRIVATDMYEGVWRDVQGREGDPGVLARPEEYAPFPYRREHLTFLKMDGRRLAFCDRTFDVAYSLSSIEHFGGMAGAVATIREMGRVLKPGGILALATEYVLSGPSHPETFRPHEIGDLIDQPGLELVQPIDESVYRRYSYTAVDLYGNPYQTPHMVVRFNDTVFTTVMIFLRRL